MEPTSVGAFVEKIRDELIAGFGLLETREAMPLGAHGELGAFRVWRGEAVARLAHVGVTLPDGSLEAQMLVVQTPGGSAVPHLGIDVMRFPTGFGVFVDLTPRVDLVAHRAYADRVYGGLDDLVVAALADPIVTVVPMPPSMLAFYSPWMVHHMGSTSLAPIAEQVGAFVERFTELTTKGVDVDGLPDANAIAERDRRHRAVLFDPDFDPVWRQVEPLLGAPAVTTIREALGAPL